MKINYNSEDLVDHHVVAGIIKDQNGDTLMQDHVKHGFRTIPVGKVKENQNVQEALWEELNEECNISVKEFNEITQRDYFYDRNGNTVKVISHLFEILKYEGEVKNNEPHKHKQQIFLSLDEIKNIPYLSDMTLLYLETLWIQRDAKI